MMIYKDTINSPLYVHVQRSSVSRVNRLGVRDRLGSVSEHICIHCYYDCYDRRDIRVYTCAPDVYYVVGCVNIGLTNP